MIYIKDFGCKDMNHQITELNRIECVQCGAQILSYDDMELLNETIVVCKECFK